MIGTSTCPLPAASEKSRAPCVNGPVGTDGGGDGGGLTPPGGGLTPPAFVGGGGVRVGGGGGDDGDPKAELSADGLGVGGSGDGGVGEGSPPPESTRMAMKRTATTLRRSIQRTGR